jgi:TolA-binding protein
MRRAYLLLLGLLLIANPSWLVAKDVKDSPAAAATRKKLKAKISVDYKDVSLKDVMEDLKQKVKDATDMDLSIQLDNAGGVSNNSTITFTAKDQPVEQILNMMFKNNGLGYIVVSKEYKTYKGRYDGWLLIVKGKERGYPEGEESAAAEEKSPAAKDKGKSTEKPTKGKPAKEKEKSVTDKGKEPAQDADKQEREAGRRLKYAKTYLEDGNRDLAIQKFKDIVKKYPKTKAAEQAKKYLEELEK